MQLIDLVRKLVENPDERDAFKADPDTYITHQEEQLQSHLRALHAKADPIEETGTVMCIATNQRRHCGTGGSLSRNDMSDELVDLSGLEVVMNSRFPFFAEYIYPSTTHSDVGEDNEHVYTCTLLQHSYIEIIQQDKSPTVSMHLNMCFVDPQDTQDQPQVLSINTLDKSEVLEDYNLGNTSVYMTLPRGFYILLRGDANFSCKLANGSFYHKADKEEEQDELFLVFDKKPIPPFTSSSQ